MPLNLIYVCSLVSTQNVHVLTCRHLHQEDARPLQPLHNGRWHYHCRRSCGFRAQPMVPRRIVRKLGHYSSPTIYIPNRPLARTTLIHHDGKGAICLHLWMAWCTDRHIHVRDQSRWRFRLLVGFCHSSFYFPCPSPLKVTKQVV